MYLACQLNMVFLVLLVEAKKRSAIQRPMCWHPVPAWRLLQRRPCGLAAKSKLGSSEFPVQRIRVWLIFAPGSSLDSCSTHSVSFVVLLPEARQLRFRRAWTSVSLTPFATATHYQQPQSQRCRSCNPKEMEECLRKELPFRLQTTGMHPYTHTQQV
eukprot:SAG31_NODE_41_length_31342_cov_8.029286_22_plen_157_part_00